MSHTVPSGAGTAEWIAAVPTFGTGNSFISPVVGIEPRDLVGAAVVGHPEIAVLVRMRAPRHAVGAGRLVFHVDDLERLVAELAHGVLVARRSRPAIAAASESSPKT